MNLSVYELRKRHPGFIYHSAEFELEKDTLLFRFHFEIEPGISFYPEISIKGITQQRINKIGKEVLNNFAFHLGLMEIPSYWKAACPPEIVIRAGSLDSFQLVWWKDLLLKGLGEFFYVNNIDFTSRDFVIIRANNKVKPGKVFTGELKPDKYLVPIGGGKDSSVTCGLLRQNNKKYIPFCLNPTQASLWIIKLNNLQNSVIAKREIDPNLLQLNKNGYLNGHTPFSAYLAFLCSLVSVLFDSKTILVSNGRSANEENTVFCEEEINHQYSKSFRFEQKFREYAKKYLTKNSVFISFLRPLYELQIAGILSKFPEYFPVFKSCNRRQKANIWCHNCAKCLFVYAILYPFIDKRILTSKIFSRDLFENKDLLSLTGKFLEVFNIKPFDCVGTRRETTVAFSLCIEKAKKSGGKLPPVLQFIEDNNLIKLPHKEKNMEEILSGWDKQNFLTKELEIILKKAVDLNVIASEMK